MDVTRAKAAAFLAAGPADASALLAYACGFPMLPAPVAEHMAMALFAGHPEFARDTVTGRWKLVAIRTTPVLDGATAMAGLTYAVVDVETTGGAAIDDRIIEVAVTVVRDGAVQETFESLVNPLRPVPAFVRRLTGISPEMLHERPVFADVCADVVNALDGHIFVAHNAKFDYRIMAREIARAGGPRLVAPRLCTVRLARRLLPHLSRRSLDHVARYYGVEITARHRAAGDAVATAHCLVRMLRDARRDGHATWGEIQRLLSMPSLPKPRRRPSALPGPVTHDTTA